MLRGIADRRVDAGDRDSGDGSTSGLVAESAPSPAATIHYIY